MTTHTALPISELANPKPTGELTTIAATNPLAILAAAVERGANPDQLEKLLALQERWERNEAAKRFAESITTFQAKCPAVFKSREANIAISGGGSYKYSFAAFEDIMQAVKPLLTECGIDIDFSTDHAADNRIKVTCRLRVGTHCEDKTLTVPVPAMKVNDTQRYGAALSYAKRYALCAALNIVVTDEDTDANGLAELVTDAQAQQLLDLLKSKGKSVDGLCNWAGVASLNELSVAKYREALGMLGKK